MSAHSQKGFSSWVFIIVAVVFAFVIVNGLQPIVSREELIYGPSPSPTPLALSCCENSDCSLLEPEFTSPHNGKKYKLLRKDISLSEGPYHLKKINLFANINGVAREIYLNDTQDLDHSNVCDQRVGQDDIVFGNPCAAIPDDALIYVCKTDKCSHQQQTADFDAYWQSDPSVPVPDVIKNCSTEGLSGGAPGTYRLKPQAPADAKDSLQLRYVEGEPVPAQSIPWLSPWCKPAIYLYPKEKTSVNVKVTPVGKMTLTIPKYPMGGWNVTANPDGKINHTSGDFDYLYYEAEIPDEKIEKPTKGYVVKYSEIEGKLVELLPKLGLNQKETSDFISYWVNVLPKDAPYFFLGVVSPKNLDQIAPLEISPQPTKVIRVTIYFQVLDGPIDVEAPYLEGAIRDGFAVVEWGGIFKSDPKYPFSCLM